MILDRLVIAGLAWTSRILLGAKMARPSTDARVVRRKAAPKRSATVLPTAERESAPAETEEVVGPDQDLLQSLNVDESMGFEDAR